MIELFCKLFSLLKICFIPKQCNQINANFQANKCGSEFCEYFINSVSFLKVRISLRLIHFIYKLFRSSILLTSVNIEIILIKRN